mgnify:CR=1 FL=1
MTEHADFRRGQLETWLRSLPPELELDLGSLCPASSDASFRRYFRIDAGASTLIVMDAPPPQEDCRPFVAMAQRLLEGGLNVPRILAQDVEQGFLLLTDLGQDTYYDALQRGPGDAEIRQWYRAALNALVRLQQVPATGLPMYDHVRLRSELELFPEWYISVHCGATLTAQEHTRLEQVFDVLVTRNSRQPQVLVHRDYHSPNLMVPLPDRPDEPGIIDFQDALAGPITYDLVSLLMDARTTWDEPQQLDWGIRYWEAARKAQLPVSHDIAEFHADWEWMGLQRNLRILGVFARLHHRDGKAQYLQHIPRVLAYVRQAAAHYDVFLPLLRLLDRLEGTTYPPGWPVR